MSPKQCWMPKFSETLNFVTSRLEKIGIRFTEAERRISNNEDELKTLKADLTVAKKTITKLIEKSEELENRSRRGNIHTLGLKEGIEGRQPALFFETFLPKALGLATDHGKVKLDGAHRTGPPRQQTLHSRYEAAELLGQGEDPSCSQGSTILHSSGFIHVCCPAEKILQRNLQFINPEEYSIAYGLPSDPLLLA